MSRCDPTIAISARRWAWRSQIRWTTARAAAVPSSWRSSTSPAPARTQLMISIGSAALVTTIGSALGSRARVFLIASPAVF